MGPVANALTIPGVLERRAAAAPSSLALIAEDGATLTYGELGEQVRVAARALLGLGIDAGDRVALWAPNSVDWVVASLATAMAGAVLVPLNTRWHLGEVLDVVDRAGCALWLAQDGFLGTPMAGPATPGAATCRVRRAGGRAGCRRARVGRPARRVRTVVGHRVGRTFSAGADP